MKLVKFLFFIGLMQAADFLKIVKPATDFLKVTNPAVAPSNVAQPEIKVSANGFKSVPWIEGVEKNEILILGPT